MSDQLANAVRNIRTKEALMYLTTDRAITWPTSRAAVTNSSATWLNKLLAMTAFLNQVIKSVQ